MTDQRLLERIREAVRNGEHRFSRHSVHELAKDRLLLEDAEAAILTGRLVREEREDSPEHPGPRYTVVGQATDLATEVGVVCRFESDQLLVVTCYEMTK